MTNHAPQKITLRPIGIVHPRPASAADQDWRDREATIALDPTYLDLSAVRGLEQFSHIEVIHLHHLVLPEAVVRGARRPATSGTSAQIGILAQQADDRPNRLGVSRCRLVAVNGLELRVRGLDVVAGTPVLDISPHMRALEPRGSVPEPMGTRELMTTRSGLTR